MPIINSVFTWFIKKRIHQIELFMKYPNEVQKEWFEQLISEAETTEWGRKYHYKDITNLRHFKERVPVQNYDTLKPYIERMLKGDQNVLWPTEIRWCCGDPQRALLNSAVCQTLRVRLTETAAQGSVERRAILPN